jgi:hypothetical protein
VALPLLVELKRRRVFRAMVGYGIAAFAVLQIVEPVMHGLHWPDAVLSYVVVAFPRGPLAAARLAVGDKEGAFAWLEKGVEEQDPILPLTVKSNQTWDPVRSDPRFQKLLRRMNLE